jgi:hypothetical protein
VIDLLRIGWRPFVLALVVFGFAPGAVLRAIVLAFRRDDPRRRELHGELYNVPLLMRPWWVVTQLELALFEGLGPRLVQAVNRLPGRVLQVPYLPPVLIDRHLLPRERIVRTVRMHPMAVIAPAALILAGALFAGFATGAAPPGSAGFVRLVWVLWAALAVWQGWKIATWWRRYFVITENRLLLVTSVLNTDVGMMPLAKVTDMRLFQTTLGRSLGYTHFIVESAGQDQALSRIEYVPFPSQMYRQILSLLFPRTPPALGE